jgi:hypothetical protein
MKVNANNRLSGSLESIASILSAKHQAQSVPSSPMKPDADPTSSSSPSNRRRRSISGGALDLMVANGKL